MNVSDLHVIERRLAEGGLVFLDGATGTELERRGAPMHPLAWCAPATETHPDVLRGIHRDYIEAGADVITANTFSTSRAALAPAGLADRFEPYNRLAVEIALRARDEARAGRPVLVAGSMAHVIPGGISRWTPRDESLSKLEEDFAEMAEILRDSGCDLILAEMMGHPELSPCLVRAARASGLPVWVGLSARENAAGDLVTYTSEALPFEECIAPIVAAGGTVFGVMHTNRDVLSTALALLRRHWDGPSSAYPDTLAKERGTDAPLPVEETSVASFVDSCREWVDTGVQVIGGCCGFTVSHIEALVGALKRS